jgi:hypothetical protein
MDEPLRVLLAAVAALIALDLAGLRWGRDSRPRFDPAARVDARRDRS